MSVGRLRLADELFDRKRHIQWMEQRIAKRDELEAWLRSQPLARQERRWAPEHRVGAVFAPTGWSPVDVRSVAESTGGWEQLIVGDGLTGWMSSDPTNAIEFSVENGPVEVAFWAHAWSGTAKIVMGGREEIIDLRDAVGGFVVVHLLGVAGAGVHRLTISPIERTDDPGRSQVIVVKVSVST